MRNSNNYTLLIIDDDPTFCLIAEKKLSMHGYHVLTADSGKQGIKLVLEHSPDLLLLDYELPDMTGVEVCLELRSHLVSADKPILFITGKDDYQSIDNAFQAGATDFSSKPLNWTILIYRIQYMLRTHGVYLSLLSSEARLSKAQKIAQIANWEYSVTAQSFKWSETIYDLFEIDMQLENNFDLPYFLGLIPERERNEVYLSIENCINDHVSFEIEHEIITGEGNIKVFSHLGNIIKNDINEVVDCIGTLQDITERRNTENQIRSLAYFDSLTGLMNRESFLTVLDIILDDNKDQNMISALFFIDLDDFKRVNDTLGHDFGDLLLCEVAERLTACVRTAELEKEFESVDCRISNTQLTDTVFRINSDDINRFDIGRLGGDEFTVFLADIANEDVAAKVASRLLKTLETPFILDNHEVYVSFSIGIAVFPKDGDEIHTLLKKADTAMYSAKANGKNNFQFYMKTMNERSLQRLRLEADLRNAISNEELYLVYQPQFCLDKGALIGAEALMRWKHKTKGEISPVDFIPLAEETGQIMAFGDWLFEQFSQDLHGWKQNGMIPDDFKLALNISSLQFHQSNMMNKIKKYFSDLELNKHVEFELTETVMMQNAESNLEKLNSLAGQNITLSIDDFGTGYSSLSYLHRFPVDTVKIDRSFISNMENDNQVNIVKAIIAMAHGMNIKVVAEGIENQWQYDFLKSEGCDIGQGYFLSKPLSVDHFQKLLKKQCAL
jgi:predicted signal transduction protein with EAL and GGDEF domain/DNA-binding response OmpR family regulator